MSGTQQYLKKGACIRSLTDVHLRQFGSYLPPHIVRNDDIMQHANSTLDGSILYRAVGSQEKRAAGNDEMGSDMMARVGMQILKEAGVDPGGVDKLICSCDVQDQAAPDTAVVTQAKLGLACPAFGISMSCSAWLCGIYIGAGFLANGDKRILVLSASTVGSKYIFNSPMHRAIFGDGAGGVLLEKIEETSQIMALDLWTDGKFYKDIFAPHRWSIVPNEVPPQYRDSFYMTLDNQVFYDAIDQYIRPFYLKQYETAGISPELISTFIIHQASMPIFNYTLNSLKIPRDRVVVSFDKYGNTVSAELPIMLDQCIRTARVKKGDLIYLLTYGAGFTAGAMILKV